ncbi:MAG: S4 domain-containing protein [Mariprofundaceae bacterium]|nr:S4 domain-containing protein [Mariprofundaceae bacterium]
MCKQTVRMDKWLWAARFYKIRSLASHACKGGHISSHGIRCKASKTVQIGDEIHIQKEDERFIIIVLALADKRGSASIAQTLYEETADSIQQRLKLAEQRKFQNMASPSPSKRPDKRQRRKIQSFKNQS